MIKYMGAFYESTMWSWYSDTFTLGGFTTSWFSDIELIYLVLTLSPTILWKKIFQIQFMILLFRCENNTLLKWPLFLWHAAKMLASKPLLG